MKNADDDTWSLRTQYLSSGVSSSFYMNRVSGMKKAVDSQRDNSSIDFSKTKAVRLASQGIGKDLWRQVYDVTYTKKSGDTIEAIAVHDASTEECSMTGVDVYVISRHLGGK